MKNRIQRLLIVSALGVAFASPVFAQNIAVVNGKPVTKASYDQVLANVEKGGRKLSDEDKERLKQEMISRELFVQEAQKENIENTPEYKQAFDQARQGLLIRGLFDKYIAAHPITDEAVKAEYDKAVAANAGKEYKVSHILVDSEAKAKDIIARLKKGAKFADIAKKESKDPGSAAKGGDLDWAPPGNYVPEFTDAMTKLKKGEYTQTPVKSQFGWHVILLTDERDAQLPPLEQVTPQIRQQLQAQQLEQFQTDLRAKAKIE